MISQSAFTFHFSIPSFTVPAVFINRRYQLIRVILIIIHLRGFKPHLVNTNFVCELLNLFYLVLVVPDYKELKENKRRFAFELFFPFYNISGTLQHLFNVTTNPVL